MPEVAPGDYAAFGRFLAQQRELRGLSRSDIAKATKIPSTLIDALETGQAERLPAKVFVLNYVKAYARAIGMSPEEAVLRFEEIDATARAMPPPAALERARTRRALVTLVVVALVAGVLVVALLTAVGIFQLGPQAKG